jgi:hypothetical protein
MSPEVLRRKLHKKSKRKRFARCSRCHGDADCRLTVVDGVLLLVKRCGRGDRTRGCGLVLTQSDTSGWREESIGRLAE